MKAMRCHQCSKQILDKFATFNFGAVNNGDMPLSIIDPFASLSFLDSDKLVSFEELNGKPFCGQMEFYFCSTNCLRDFFNKWVDRLEIK